jgi:hypothetical protein
MAMVRMERAFAEWNVERRIAVSMAGTDMLAISTGVRAFAKSSRATWSVISSRVRTEMMQATTCSNGESKPSSASSNMAALGR